MKTTLMFLFLTACGGSSPGVFQRTLPDADVDAESDDSGDAMAVSSDTGSPVKDAGVAEASRCFAGPGSESIDLCCPTPTNPLCGANAKFPFTWTCEFTTADGTEGQWDFTTLGGMSCASAQMGTYLWCCTTANNLQ